MHLKAALAAASVLSFCSLARAEQFVLVDLSYTHSADTTKDSHYYPTLAADTPKDWTKPVDYSHGSVHIVLDVKTKPAGDTPTKFQICFEGTPSYGCTAQSPTYTKTGRVEWDSPFSGFWYESTVDWSQGIKKMPLILKDTMNNKPAGDPKYMPTDLHVQVTLVSPDAKFVPPAAAGSGGAGAGGGAGMSNGGAGGGAPNGGAGGAGRPAAAGSNAAGRGTSGSGGGAGSAPAAAGSHAGSGSPNSGAGGSTPIAAGSAAPAAGSGTVGGAGAATGSDADEADSGSGCRSTGSSNWGAWTLNLLYAYLATRRRRPRPAAHD